MRDIPVKVNGDSLDATDFNSVQNELENVITSSGQTLDPVGGPDTDLTQLGKAISMSGGTSMFYKDTGVANSYVLSKTTNFDNPAAYIDGMIAVFIPSNNNSGASTVNIAGLGTKNIVIKGLALTSGQLRNDKYAFIQYDQTNDVFELMFFQLSPREEQFNVFIDPAGNGADFASLSDYLNGTPVSGDNVFVRGNQTVTSTMTFPANVRVEFAPGVTVTVNGAISPIIVLNSGVEIPSIDLTVDTSLGAIATAISYNTGATDSKIDKFTITDSNPTNQITTVVTVNSGADNNLLHGSIINASVGSIYGGAGFGSALGLSNDFQISQSNNVSVNVSRSTGAGDGIDFSNAGTAGRILTDYSDGTYTAQISGSVSGSYTLSQSTARFIKIGSMVHVQGYLVVSADPGVTGQLFVTLPFTPSSTNTSMCAVSIENGGSTISGKTIMIFDGNLAGGTLHQISDTGIISNITDTDVDTAWELRFSGQYAI